MAWKDREITNWKDLMGVAESLGQPFPWPSAYVFRGQANADWPLVPSLTRQAKSLDLAREKLVEIEALLMHDFRAAAHGLPEASIVRELADLARWWGVMQHHRAPTRLLDWTRSLYVATYFAVVDEIDRPGAVWFFGDLDFAQGMWLTHGEGSRYGEDVTERNERLLNVDAPEVMWILTLQLQTERMLAQQSHFSLCTQVWADHGEVIGGALGKYPPGAMKNGKLIIPSDRKMEILAHLKNMNITASTLFPGADGLGRSMWESLLLANSRLAAEEAEKEAEKAVRSE